MDSPAVIHFPATLAGRDARLFWLLATELYRADLVDECDALIGSDWSDLIEHEESEDFASQLAELTFAKDDLERLLTISEGFSPDAHPLYFRRLRALGKSLPGSKKSIAWMQSQKLIGAGLDGFKTALREGHVELARSLHQPTPTEAEGAFYEIASALTKESLSVLVFMAPSLVDFKALAHASQARASEEALCFLTWKIEESRDKKRLRSPDGDDELLGSLLLAALTRRHFVWAKKLLEWNHSLAFDKFEPRELAPPWEGDAVPIKLDAGALSLMPADFAALYGHEGFARSLAHLQAPAPNVAKISALAGALTKKLESRRPGAGAAWASAHLAKAQAIVHSLWRPA